MLVFVYTCQNTTLLEITCHGSNMSCSVTHHSEANSVSETACPLTYARS